MELLWMATVKNWASHTSVRKIGEEDKLNDKTASSLGQRDGWLINESGLYALVFDKLGFANKLAKDDYIPL